MNTVYIGVKEVKGEVPGTTRGGVRTKSAINNYQASGYVKAPEGVTQCLGLPRHQAEAPTAQYGASRWRHICKNFNKMLISK